MLSFHELKDCLFVSKLLVDSCKCAQFALDVIFVFVLWVKEYLQLLGTIHTDASPLPDNLSRTNNILQDGFVDRCQGAGAWPYFQTFATEILVKNGAVCNKNYMPLRKLLLQLSDQTALD